MTTTEIETQLTQAMTAVKNAKAARIARRNAKTAVALLAAQERLAQLLPADSRSLAETYVAVIGFDLDETLVAQLMRVACGIME